MGKKARVRTRNAASATGGTSAAAGPGATGDIPVVGGREPCPCGSGRRYKACHGRDTARDTLVRRPFEGLPGECDWVALREIVPAATAELKLAADPERGVTVATVLPMAWPAMVRPSGDVLLGLQTHTASGDANRDVAAALERALEAEPGTAVPPGALPGAGKRLNDLLDLSVTPQVVVHQGFDFWVDDPENVTDDVTAALEQANTAVTPTARLTSVEAAYWCRTGERTHLRWVLPHEEDTALDALARLTAAGANTMGEGSRYLGAFRAHGLLVPVWEVPQETEAEDLEKPAAELHQRLGEALGADGPLSMEERRVRGGLVGRQLTIR